MTGGTSEARWILALSCALPLACGRADIYLLPNSTVAVAPVYVGNGSDWNDYVVNDGADPFSASDTACDPVADIDCLHAGELRMVVLDGFDRCTELAADDELGAFHWICDETDDGVTFYSTNLRVDRGLRDLLAAAAWLPNRVRVTLRGELIAESEPAVWWDNPVSVLPQNAGATDPTYVIGVANGQVAGEIVTLSDARRSQGVNIDLDGVALVGLNGARLEYGGSATFNCSATAGETSGGPDMRCLIAAGRQSFLWVEGLHLDATGTGSAADRGLFLERVRHSMVRHLAAVNTAAPSGGCPTSAPTEPSGVVLYEADDNRLVNLDLARHDNIALSLIDSSRNRVAHASVTNSCAGIQARRFSGSTGARHNVFSRVLAANNERCGLCFAWEARGITLSGVTVVNNSAGASGAAIDSSSEASGMTAHNVVVANNAGLGMHLSLGGLYATLSQMVLAHNGDGGILLEPDSNVRLAGNLLVEDAQSDCVVPLGGVDLDNSCQSSGANTISGVALGAAFVGNVGPPGDSANLSDANGSAGYSADLDWVHFDNRYRAWGPDGATFPSADQRGPCAAGTCRIRDWRLRAGAQNPIANRSGDGETANGAASTDAPCPAEVSGNVVATDLSDLEDLEGSKPVSTFLLGALELVSDAVGDNDGLCESGEACVHAPSFGTHQGEGDFYAHRCTFEDGVVTGVTMYLYPQVGG